VAQEAFRTLSTGRELERIAKAVAAYCYLPFATDSVPGAYVEAAVANVRGGKVLRTYDFVDVVAVERRIGWQVKSTKQSTPVTWKRAKIPGAPELIAASRDTDERAREEGLQALGDAIIGFCNLHAVESLEKYDLDEIGFSRVLVRPSEIVYYERELLSRERPQIFDPADFKWQWSIQKTGKKKEQLSALHGKHGSDKWFAWHGLGENQLHFSGEHHWWPSTSSSHQFSLPLPPPHERLDFAEFGELIDSAVAKPSIET
jgi:hypothetical protein